MGWESGRTLLGGKLRTGSASKGHGVCVGVVVSRIEIRFSSQHAGKIRWRRRRGRAWCNIWDWEDRVRQTTAAAGKVTAHIAKNY